MSTLPRTDLPAAPRRSVRRSLLAALLLAGLGGLAPALQGALAAPDPAADAAADASAAVDGAVEPDHRGGPIIIIDPWWPTPLDPLPRHCPHPCPRLIIRFPCGDPAGAFLPPAPPGLPNPGVTPGPTATLVPRPSPTPGGAASTQTYRVCPQLSTVIPQSVQDLAVAEPWRINGYGQKANPNIPFHPLWNPYRTWLSLRDPRQPYSICNLPVWKSGCP